MIGIKKEFYTPGSLKATVISVLEKLDHSVWIDLIEVLLKWDINKFMLDKIAYDWDNNKFTWEVSFIDANSQERKIVQFNTSKITPLSPFIYSKPEVSDGWDVYNSANISTKETCRWIWWDGYDGIEYYPLCFTPEDTAPLRGPTHLDKPRQWLFCAIINKEWKAETRYFPKNNISPEAWKQAEDIITQQVA